MATTQTERSLTRPLRVGDQIRLVVPHVGPWKSVSSLSDNYVSLDNEAPVSRRLLTRYIGEGRIEVRLKETKPMCRSRRGTIHDDPQQPCGREADYVVDVLVNGKLCEGDIHWCAGHLIWMAALLNEINGRFGIDDVEGARLIITPID